MAVNAGTEESMNRYTMEATAVSERASNAGTSQAADLPMAIAKPRMNTSSETWPDFLEIMGP